MTNRALEFEFFIIQYRFDEKISSLCLLYEIIVKTESLEKIQVKGLYNIRGYTERAWKSLAV